MQTFIAALAIFAIAVGVMSLGVLITGRRMRGSCGGTGENCHCSNTGALTCDTRKHRMKEHSAS